MRLIILSCCLCLWLAPLLGQELDIVGQPKVEKRAGTVSLWFRAVDERGQPIDSQALDGNLRIIETVNEQEEEYRISKRTSRHQLRSALQPVEGASKQDTITLDLLMDVGQGVSDTALMELADLLRPLPDRLSSAQQYRLFTFATGLLHEPKHLAPEDFGKLSQWLQARPEPTYLYENLDRVLKAHAPAYGKRVLLLASPGHDQAPDTTVWRWRTAEDVMTYLDSSAVDGQWLFTLGIGDSINTTALRALPQRTTQPADAYYSRTYPVALDSLTDGRVQYQHTHRVDYKPKDPLFNKRTRTLQLVYRDGKGKEYISSPVLVTAGRLEPINVEDSSSATLSLLGYGFIGILGLAAVALLGGFLLPAWRDQQFYNKYVRPYAITPGHRHKDPLTNMEIREGELVVHRCAQLVTWATWKYMGHQCPNYPSCIRSMPHLNCQGQGARTHTQSVLVQSNENQRLHWLVLGIAGGLLSWIFLSLFDSAGLSLYRSLAEAITSGAIDYAPDELVNRLIIGIAFAPGLTLLLSFAEERGQSRYLSWGRIALRTLLATLLVATIFLSGFWAQVRWGIPAVLADILMWSLFGVAVGGVLSIRSTVPHLRGLWGGLLAGVLAYGCFWLVGTLLTDPQFARLLSLMLMGGVLGYVLVSVARAAEDVQVEYLSPVKYQRTVPVSKWLKQGIEVDIGTQQGSYLPVKWPDPEAADRHALLSLEGGKVYLLALAETLVDNRLLSAKDRAVLKNGSVIRLGRRGSSQFRVLID